MSNDSKRETVTRYRVRNWSEFFENAQSRKYQRLSWVPIPNKHDGKSYRRLMAHDDGPALYGAWLLIVQVASKCPVRGVLADADGVLDADDLAAKTGCPASLFVKAFELLTHPKVAWLEVEQLPADSQHAKSVPTVSPGTLPLNGTEANRTNSEKKQPPPPRPHTLTDADASEVEGVEVLLSEAGITTAGTTTRLAVERGYTASRVRELLDWLRSHRDSFDDWKAALVFRLKNSPPATPADQGWPPSKSKSRDGADDRLEKQFGNKLELKSPSELRALAERAGIANAAKLSSDQLSHLRERGTANRRKLIEQLAREHSSRGQGDKPP
jgi:hypothetical protein